MKYLCIHIQLLLFDIMVVKYYMKEWIICVKLSDQIANILCKGQKGKKKRGKVKQMEKKFCEKIKN